VIISFSNLNSILVLSLNLPSKEIIALDPYRQFPYILISYVMCTL